MSGDGQIKTRCPVCQSKYRVPAASVGQRARCAKCQTRFQVAEIRPTHPAGLPTENDILSWLNEGMDEERIAARPRIVSGGDPDLEPARSQRPPISETRSRPDVMIEPALAALCDGLTDPSLAEPGQGEPLLRRTG